MPARAFIDSDGYWAGIWVHLNRVVMPARAFIDSDAIYHCYTRRNAGVVMPARAFVDSDASCRSSPRASKPSKCPRGHLLILIEYQRLDGKR